MATVKALATKSRNSNPEAKDAVIASTIDRPDTEIFKAAPELEPTLTPESQQTLSEMSIEGNWINPALKNKFIDFANKFIETHGAINLKNAMSPETAFKFVLKQLNDRNILVPSLKSYLYNQVIKKSGYPMPMSGDIKDYAIFIQAQYGKGILDLEKASKNVNRNEFLYTCRDLLEEEPALNSALLTQLLPSNVSVEVFAALKREGLFDILPPNSARA